MTQHDIEGYVTKARLSGQWLAALQSRSGYDRNGIERGLTVDSHQDTFGKSRAMSAYITAKGIYCPKWPRQGTHLGDTAALPCTNATSSWRLTEATSLIYFRKAGDEGQCRRISQCFER